MTLQRLFSSFAEGWPGFGLLLQRVLTSAVVLYFEGTHLLGSTNLVENLPHLLAALAGLFLLFGLWTPLTGSALTIIEAWILFEHAGNPLVGVVLLSLGATIAMIGPGVWSIDAHLYGRKRIEPSKQ